jgi:tetratricopeptide (TPR) repeat protein
VLGGDCAVGILRATSGRSEEEMVDAVDHLMRLRILRELPGSTRLGFALDAMQSTLYGELTPVRRRLLHGRAADALARAPGAESDARSAAAIAGHLRGAGRDEEAAWWFGVAGDLAASVFAHVEACEAYRTALALGHDDDPALLVSLGEELLLMSRFAEALEAFGAAAAAGDPEVTARAEHRIGDIHRRLGRFQRAEHHFALAEPHHPNPARLYADRALLAHRRSDLARAAALARRGVEHAVEAGDAGAEARARDVLGIVTDDRAELERALVLAGDDPSLRTAALNSLAAAVARAGDPGRAISLVEEAIVLGEKVGDRHRHAALLNHLADLLHRTGREEESRRALKDAVRLFAELQPDTWEPEVWLLTRW